MAAMLDDDQVEFTDRRYGKDSVCLLHVRRLGDQHFIKELEVDTKLTLSSVKDFKDGDNADIVATDSQKNTVYVLAKKHGVRSIEEFAIQLCTHFLKQYGHVDIARVRIEERPWRRISQGGKEHLHSFLQMGEGTRYCFVEQFRNEAPIVHAGLKDLKVLKTTQSAFVNFYNDEYRTLPDMEDRVFCTVYQAFWTYGTLQRLDFDKAWQAVKDTVIEHFAGPADTGAFSASVQKTMYNTQRAVLAKVPQIDEINVTLPNVHAYEFDFSKFKSLNIKNEGEVFQPTDKPSGNISSTLKRKVISKL